MHSKLFLVLLSVVLATEARTFKCDGNNVDCVETSEIEELGRGVVEEFEGRKLEKDDVQFMKQSEEIIDRVVAFVGELKGNKEEEQAVEGEQNK